MKADGTSIGLGLSEKLNTVNNHDFPEFSDTLSTRTHRFALQCLTAFLVQNAHEQFKGPLTLLFTGVFALQYKLIKPHK